MAVAAVELELALEEGRVRTVADGDEDAFNVDCLVGFALRGGELKTRDALAVAEHFLDCAVELERDAAFPDGLHQVVDHDGFGAEGVAAVHERDVAGDVGEVEGLLDGCIAAAHNRDGLAAVEEAVARGAARDALALVLLLAFKTEVHGGGARRDDERVAGVFAAHVALEREGTLGKIDGGDHVEGDLGAEALGLLLKAFHELGALDAVDGGGPVVDFGGRHELTAVVHARDEHGLEVGASGVDGGGEAGGAGPEDDELAVFGFHGKNLRWTCAFGAQAA